MPSNLCAVVTPQKQEILINGVLQGRKQEDPRGASCVSRRKMWEAAEATLARNGMEALQRATSQPCKQWMQTTERGGSDRQRWWWRRLPLTLPDARWHSALLGEGHGC